MKRFSIVYFLSVVLLLITGCQKSYSVCEFWICNESGQDLYVESSIVSELTSDGISFLLNEGADHAILLAKSKRYNGTSTSYLPLSCCVNNQDARVRLYTVSAEGEKHLVHTWYYSEREKGGRELFNEECLTQGFNYLLDGGHFPSFTFTILPEDISIE